MIIGTSNDPFSAIRLPSASDLYRENFGGDPTENVRTPAEFPEAWRHGSGVKALEWHLSKKFDPNVTTVLGGFCALFTAETEAIRTGCLTFGSITEFREWMLPWFPRMDQIHDTVGHPPKAVKNLVYVFEDSLFGRRIAKWTGLPEQGVTDTLKEMHLERGHPALQKWLRENGYRGNIQLVFTSDLNDELETTFRLWKRMIQRDYQIPEREFTKHKDLLKVQLMYTAGWLDVLHLDGLAAVYEPITHKPIDNLPESLNGAARWFTDNEHGQPGSWNSELGSIFYLPFLDCRGHTRLRPFNTIPNRQNWESFQFERESNRHYGANLIPRDIQNKTLPEADLVQRLRTVLAYTFT